MAWWPYLIVFAGAGVGGAMRHGMNELVSNLAGTRFPWGIMAINVSGSLLLGLFAGYFAFKGEASQHWRLFLTTGICGGYTTFSTFSLDTVLLWERGEATMAIVYVVASVLISIAALVLGMWAMRG
ncbi:MAG TPA: fluoride efflux transporter CrcB [Burkholderiales bacterium]|nr:fluoride efflux transporter CrcB [Burkholderiales bacterium]